MAFVPRALAALLVLALATGCGGDGPKKPKGAVQQVGHPCEVVPGSSTQPTSSEALALINSAARECPSQLCVLPAAANGPTTTGPTCTATCDNDADCEGAEQADGGVGADQRCKGSFLCRPISDLGSFACRKLCICTDFLNPSKNLICPT